MMQDILSVQRNGALKRHQLVERVQGHQLCTIFD